MRQERPINFFPYLYAIMVMIVVQFLAMLYLVGRIETQMSYLRGAVDRLKMPVRNEVVTVGNRMVTTMNGELYEVVVIKNKEPLCPP